MLAKMFDIICIISIIILIWLYFYFKKSPYKKNKYNFDTKNYNNNKSTGIKISITDGKPNSINNIDFDIDIGSNIDIDKIIKLSNQLPLKLSINSVVKTLTVDSFTSNDVSYNVNLEDMTCTCNDFYEIRTNFPKYDIRRFCKHIRYAISKRGLDNQLPEYAQYIFNDPYSYKLKQYFIIKQINGHEVVLGFIPDNEWINIYSRRKKKNDMPGINTGKYQRYGYNYREKRWSYGIAPDRARNIKMFLKELLKK